MAEERVQRRLAAILAADVVGYSRLMGEDEASAFAVVKAKRIIDERGDRRFRARRRRRTGLTPAPLRPAQPSVAAARRPC